MSRAGSSGWGVGGWGPGVGWVAGWDGVVVWAEEVGVTAVAPRAWAEAVRRGVGGGGVGDNHGGTGVVQHVFEFGKGMGDGERYRNASACPDAELYRHMDTPRRNQVGDSVAGPRRRQAGAPRHCLARKLGVAAVRAAVHDRDAVGAGRVGDSAR